MTLIWILRYDLIWYVVYIFQMCTLSEKNVIDSIIDSEKGSQLAGELDYKIIQSM